MLFHRKNFSVSTVFFLEIENPLNYNKFICFWNFLIAITWKNPKKYWKVLWCFIEKTFLFRFLFQIKNSLNSFLLINCQKKVYLYLEFLESSDLEETKEILENFENFSLRLFSN